MGHHVGLDDNYLRPQEQDIENEYRNIDALTIDPANRLQKKIQLLEVEKNQFEQLAAKIASLEKK